MVDCGQIFFSLLWNKFYTVWINGRSSCAWALPYWSSSENALLLSSLSQYSRELCRQTEFIVKTNLKFWVYKFDFSLALVHSVDVLDKTFNKDPAFILCYLNLNFQIPGEPSGGPHLLSSWNEIRKRFASRACKWWPFVMWRPQYNLLAESFGIIFFGLNCFVTISNLK